MDCTDSCVNTKSSIGRTVKFVSIIQCLSIFEKKSQRVETDVNMSLTMDEYQDKFGMSEKNQSNRS